MEEKNKYKAIVASVGLIAIGAATILTKEPVCLWSILLLMYLINEM